MSVGCRMSVGRGMLIGRGISVSFGILPQERRDSIGDALTRPCLRAESELCSGGVAHRDRDVGNLFGLQDPLKEAPAGRAIGIAEEGMAGESNDPPRRERNGEIGTAHRCHLQ